MERTSIFNRSSSAGRCFWLLLVVNGAVAGLPVTTPGSIVLQFNQTQETTGENWQVETAFRPDSQRTMSKHSDSWDVSLTTWKACPDAPSNWCYFFRIQNRLDRRSTTFRLANQTAQVDALSIIGRTRLAILGHALPNLPIVTVVDLPSGQEIDRIVCGGRLSLSPDQKYFAYLKFVPAHPGYDWSPSAEYLVYDLAASPEENRTLPNRGQPLNPYDVGRPVYPEGLQNVSGDNMLEGHDVPARWMISPFYWLGKSDTLSFIDRYEGTASLILADLSGGIQRPKVSVYPLDIGQVVNFSGCRPRVSPQDLQSWSKRPVDLIEVREIQVSPENKAALRLHLAPQPCLKGDVLDVPIGFRVGN